MLLAKPLYPAAELAQPHFFAYGLGWFLQDYRGRLLAMHTGSLYGANALVALMPEEKLGLVIFIDAESVEYRHAFMYDVLDRFVDRHDRDWNAEIFKRYHDLYAKQEKERAAALAARPANRPPSLPLTSYAGVYNNPVAGDAEVTLADGKLSLLMKPDAVLPLTHWSFDTFEAVDRRAPDERFLVTFVRGADGKIVGYDSGEGRKYQRR